MHKAFFALLMILLILVACGNNDQPQRQVKHPDWITNKTIYELNIRQFSQSGTFKAVTLRMAAIKELGAGIVWLMPIHPIGEKNRKGTLGSYYSVKDYLDVNPEFGAKEDFRALVGRAHEMGLYVILDWVANHCAWDNPLIEEHPDWFTRDSLGNMVPPVADWSDVVDFNYNNPDMRAYMLEALKYWVREFDIDGYRCDVAEMVPLDFWEQVRIELDKIKPVFMLAEGSDPALHRKAFDMTYDWKTHKAMNDIARGRKNAAVIDSLLRAEQELYPENAFRMRFTSNHDENSWQGTVFERLGDGAKTFAALSATIPGKPLLYSGQETGMQKRLDFFEKDPIEWRVNSFRKFYQRLFNQYQKNPALHKGSYRYLSTDNDQAVYAFIRRHEDHKVFALYNLSGDPQRIKIESSHIKGDYRELFSGVSVAYGAEHIFDLEPWGYRIYINTE